MRIKSPQGYIADVPDAIAQVLITQKGWVITTEQPTLPSTGGGGEHVSLTDYENLVKRIDSINAAVQLDQTNLAKRVAAVEQESKTYALKAEQTALATRVTTVEQESKTHALKTEQTALATRVTTLEAKPTPTGDVTKAYVDAEIAALKVQTTAQTTQALATVSNRPAKPVSLPAVGMGSFADFTAKAGSINWNHNAAPGENYILVITGVTVPAAVSSSQAWTNTVVYGGVNLPLLDRVLTAPENAGGTDKTHGFIEIYGGWITSTGKVEVNVSAANSARYTLRGTSLSFSGVRGPKAFAKNGAAVPRVVKFTSGNTSNRVIVAAFSPTSPSTLTVKRTSGAEAGSVYIDNPMVETSIVNPARPTTKLSAPAMAFRIFEEEGLAGGHTFTSTTSSNVISGTTGDGFSSAMIGVELEAW